MWDAHHYRRRRLILSVSTLVFFISSFSAVLALDFSGPVISVLDGDTIKVLHTLLPGERLSLRQASQASGLKVGLGNEVTV